MSVTIDMLHTPALLPIDEARSIVAKLNADPDDDWLYYTEPEADYQFAKILIVDEAHLEVGYL